MEPKMNENIDLKCYVDSDWGGNKVKRKIKDNHEQK